MRILLKGWVCAPDFSGLSRKAVLIENDRIIAVETDISGTSAADKIFTFKKEIISPGFIDAHGHSDLSAPAAPECFSKISQGITSEICGNCGLSAFPVTPANREHLEALYANYGVPLDWADFPGYMKRCTEYAPELRLFPLCGHNTLRAAVSGYEEKRISSKECDRMCRMLADQLDAGAVGLSSGLLYVPGCFAEADEILALMGVLAIKNKPFTTHLRSEGDRLLESLEEIFELACRAGVHKVQISHLKTAGSDNFGKLDRAFALIGQYRSGGLDIRFDRYPYIESQTMLSVVLGKEYSGYGDGEISALFNDPEERRRAVDHLHSIRNEQYWKTRRLAGTGVSGYRKYQGMFFADIPGDPAENVVDILYRSAPDSMVASANMSERNMLEIISHEQCVFGSDGNALPPDDRFGQPHPRSFGGAPRFARLLLDRGIAIPEVCARLSGNAAEFFGLPGVGSVTAGNFADLTVFDPDVIDSAADFRDPFRSPQGITAVLCSGRIRCF